MVIKAALHHQTSRVSGCPGFSYQCLAVWLDWRLAFTTHVSYLKEDTDKPQFEGNDNNTWRGLDGRAAAVLLQDGVIHDGFQRTCARVAEPQLAAEDGGNPEQVQEDHSGGAGLIHRLRHAERDSIGARGNQDQADL